MKQSHPHAACCSLALALSSWMLPAQAAPAATACHVPRYTVVELPFRPSALNSSGVVAGTTPEQRAAVWSHPSGMRELSIPLSVALQAPAGITESGDVVVNSTDVAARTHTAVIYSGRSVTTLPGNQIQVHGVTPSDLIVGEWLPPGQQRNGAVYWLHNQPHAIPLCCGGVLRGANNHGEMVGDAYDEQGRFHGFVWSSEQGLRVLASTDGYSSAVAINDAGHILLQMGGQAYLDEAGTLKQLVVPQGLHTDANALNNCDFVVGGYGVVAERFRAFLWTPKGGLQELDSLIPKTSGWRLRVATAMNDRGEIVGFGAHGGDDSRGFLLVPRH